jgi:dsRNA-specific ribonuclease
MTAYSFGNRWMGIIALGDPPPPEPLHKMALRLREKSLSRKIRVDKILTVPVTTLLLSLAGIRVRMAIAGQDARSQESLTLERLIRSGQTPDFRPWLREELIRVHAPEREKQPAAGSRPNHPALAGKQTSLTSERIIATGWGTSYPQAPDSPWLPPTPDPLLQDLRRLNLDLDENALMWVRWACLHRSYLYESVPTSPISPATLDLLATLGQGWMRQALLDIVRSQYGEFTSKAGVSAALATDHQARSALGVWVNATGAAFYGKGEADLLTAGSKSRAPETVAMQILGALSLVTASQTAADRLLELVSFEPSAPEPDWRTLLASHLKREPQFTRTESGPPHDRLFTVTVEANGYAASASAGSAKAATRAASRSYVLQFMPRALPKAPTSTKTPLRPQLYRANLPLHVSACGWTQQAFEVADPGLMSQALTHSSWAYENRALVTEANQSDYGTLAAEGSEVLTNLVRHQYALQTLNASFQIPTSAVASPNVPRDVVVELFELMPVASGVLRSSGTALSPDLKEDVTQAIAAAAWRANGDLLMERQPLTFAQWIRSFTPARDPVTQLQEYCARLQTTYLVDFERRGPDHHAEHRATIIFEMDGRPRWHSQWHSAQTPAKQEAAADVLDYLAGQDSAARASAEAADGHVLLRGMLLAELRAVDPLEINVRKELAIGRLGVDLLAAGAYDGYLRWSVLRSQLLPSSGSAVATRLAQYYEVVLTQQRREAVRHWVIEHTPSRGTSSSDPESASPDPESAERIRRWWAGQGAGRLALLEELLAAMQNSNPVNAVLEYVALQAQVIATASGMTLESERSTDTTGQTLTVRLPGAELSDAFEPVTEVVESVVGGANWVHDSQAVSVTFPNMPTVTDPVSRAGLDAVQRALHDPWLERIRHALTDFLSVAERVLATTTDPTSTQLEELLEELAASELSLVSRLRAVHEEVKE